MTEVKIQTHFIVTDIQDEYNFKWIGNVFNSNPKIENGKPIFIIVGSRGRSEINTTNMVLIERCAKSLTQPKGRSAVTTDTARIFIKEVNDNEKLLGILTHNHIKTFVPMHDKVGWRDN